MLGSSLVTKAPGSGAIITGVAVIMLGAAAGAIPAGPIEIRTDMERGMLVGHADIGPEMAEQFALTGYSYLAVNLSGADLGKDSLLSNQLRETSARNFKVCAWIESGVGRERAQELLSAFAFKGVFVHGANASELATALSVSDLNAGVKVYAVESSGNECVALGPDRFPGKNIEMPVLIGDAISAAKVDKLRATAEGNYLVVRSRLGR